MIENLINETWDDIPDFPGFKISNYKRIKKICKNQQEIILLPSKETKNGITYRLSKNKQRVCYLVRKYKIEDLPNEIWKNIKNYESLYQVSNYGRIKSKVRIENYDGLLIQRDKQLLHPCTDFFGYSLVGLCKNGIMKTMKVHKLVATTFLENPKNLPEVNHLDTHKNNNKLENLEWSTSRDNKLHAFKFGLMVARKGSASNWAKLTENDILEIRKIYLEKNLTQKEIADKYGVTQQQISRIVNKKRWAHI